MGNSFDPFNPEHWANESIAILEENMIAAQLVSRDFNDYVASYGQTVHTRKPSELTAEPYEKGDAITIQDAAATDVEVKLDTMLDTSFKVFDVEQTYSFKNLVELYIYPAMMAQGRILDRKILGKASQFLGNRVSGLGLLSKTTAHDTLVDAHKQFNMQKCSEAGRSIVFTPSSHAHLLKTDLFVAAERAGSSETQRNASLGPKFGIQNWMSLNTPGASGATTATATTTTANTLAGATTVLVTSASNLAKGTYFTVVGDMTPQRVGALNTLTITTTRPFLNATTSGAAVQPYANGAVDLVGGYAAGWNKWIHVDGTGVPKLGQIVSFQDASNNLHADEYVIVDVKAVSSDYEIRLDRPLVTALANDDIINYGPTGDINFAFQRNAIALVNRPLATPSVPSGARVAVARSHNMSMRVILAYDNNYKALTVSIDSLFGIKTLDTQYGFVVYG